MSKSPRPPIIGKLKPFDLAQHLAEEAAADEAELARIKAEVATPKFAREMMALRPDLKGTPHWERLEATANKAEG